MKPIPITHLKEIKRLLKQGKHTHREIARLTRTGISKVTDISMGRYDPPKRKGRGGYWDDRFIELFI